MLNGLRVLDFADEKGALCGKILGDLGADVVKVERPDGDAARRIGPFFGDDPNPERSLHWFAMNGSKRGITLNIEDPDGRELCKKLVAGADVLIESFRPGYLEELGLGYATLKERNPRLILTSITPFGQSGPFKDRKASDLTILAMSGIMSVNGQRDCPPLRMCLDQSYYLASAQAAAATLLGVTCRHSSWTGQHVDVSIYEAAVRANYREPILWEWEKKKTPRMGNHFARAGTGYRQLWPSSDGYVTWLIMLDNPKPLRAWVDWMKEEGTAGRWGDIDWAQVDSLFHWSTDDVEAVQLSIGAFIATHTTAELAEGSTRRGLLLSPVHTLDQVAKDEQLLQRNAWKDIEHPELGRSVTYPRSSFLSNEGGSEIRFRAPLIGEHNVQIYGGELGLGDDAIALLKERHVL